MMTKGILLKLFVLFLLAQIECFISATLGSKLYNNQKEVPYKDYSGWRVLKLMTRSKYASQLINNLAETNPGLVLLSDSSNGSEYHQIQVAVSPRIAQLGQLFPADVILTHGDVQSDEPLSVDLKRGHGSYDDYIFFSEVISDLGSLIRPGGRQSTMTGNETLDWTNYYRYKSFQRFGNQLSKNYKYVKKVSLGRTHQGQKLFAVVFSTEIKNILKIYRRFRKKEVASKTLLMKNISKSKVNLKRELKTSNKTIIMRGKKKENDQYRFYYKVFRPKSTRKKKKKKKKKGEHKKLKGQKISLSKPIVMIEAGTHAREWIAPSVAAYMADAIAKNDYSIISETSWIIVMMVNPDGYEYTHETDRLWRKNMKHINNSDCIGVDLNRNWEYGWGQEGSSSDPCSVLYKGEASLSEPEVMGIGQLTFSLKKYIKLYIALHNFSEMVLYPWSTTEETPKHEKVVKRTSLYMASLLNKFRKESHYESGQSSSMLYKSSGVSTDWTYSMGITHSYIIELPDRGYYGFIIPAEEIISIANSTWYAVKCSAQAILKQTRDNLCELDN